MIKLTARQEEQLATLQNKNYKHQLYYGGVRTGKTVGIINYLIMECVDNPGLRVVITTGDKRKFRMMLLPSVYIVLDKSDFTCVESTSLAGNIQKVYSVNIPGLQINFPNGSSIQFLEINRLYGYSHFDIVYVNDIFNVEFEEYYLISCRTRQLISEAYSIKEDHWSYKSFFTEDEDFRHIKKEIRITTCMDIDYWYLSPEYREELAS